MNTQIDKAISDCQKRINENNSLYWELIDLFNFFNQEPDFWESQGLVAIAECATDDKTLFKNVQTGQYEIWSGYHCGWQENYGVFDTVDDLPNKQDWI